MIYLTRRDEDKTKILINHNKIMSIENALSGSSNILMDNGKVFTVAESEEEIRTIVIKYNVSIIKTAINESKRS